MGHETEQIGETRGPQGLIKPSTQFVYWTSSPRVTSHPKGEKQSILLSL